jgi:hypothetical protein
VEASNWRRFDTPSALLVTGNLQSSLVGVLHFPPDRRRQEGVDSIKVNTALQFRLRVVVAR